MTSDAPKKILFVDDEPNVLEGLENLLRRHRRKWELSFAVGGEAALDALEKQRFDVIVSDMRMPGVDGAMLLKRAQVEHPEAVRFVLSGTTEVEAAMRAVPVAHRFLTKPCDVNALENAIDRACGLQALIRDEVVREIVSKLEKLPSEPRTYAALRSLLADERAGVPAVVQILQQDMAMCAKLLQLVNSGFFGIARRVTSIEQAVLYLGFNMVKNLALSVELFEAGESPRGISLEALQRHALLTASIARRICEANRRHAEDAFMAGMLHDIGKLVLALERPEHLETVDAKAREDQRPLYEVERELFGVTHAEIGGYLLGIWGVPYTVIEAVANHHFPERVPQTEFDVLTATYVADILAHELDTAPGDDHVTATVDPMYLERLGVADRLPCWRDVAIECVAAHGHDRPAPSAQAAPAGR